jgi:hypothetical protein
VQFAATPIAGKASRIAAAQPFQQKHILEDFLSALADPL